MPAVRKSAPEANPGLSSAKPDYDRPGKCAWSGSCPSDADGKPYQGRGLCLHHSKLAHGIKPGMPCWPRQLLCAVLRLPLTKEERAVIGNMSYADREAKVKGLPCDTCGRNVPDPSPSAVRVWCWQCVLYGKYNGAEATPTHTEAPEPASKSIGRPREVSDVEARLENVANGKETLVFHGGKGDNTFTSNPAGNVLVQDNKGVTVYNLKDEDHNRIVTARLQRWLAKAEPESSTGRVILKGPRLDVRIKA